MDDCVLNSMSDEMEEDAMLNRAFDQFEQRGGAVGPLFTTQFHEIGIPRQWIRRTAQKVDTN